MDTKPVPLVGEDWAIVSDARGIYLGRVEKRDDEACALVLSPAYQYQAQWTVDREGQMGGMRYCFPLDLAPSVDSVEVHRPCSTIWLDTLDEDDRAELSKLVRQAEDMRDMLAANRRVRRSGLVVASDMPKVKPIDGGRA